MKKLFLNLMILIPLSIWGQKEVNFTVSINSDTVGMNDNLEVTFTLENAQTKKFTPPDFEGFEAQGPSTASSMSIVNGDMSQKISYTYYLTPKAQGNFVIGKATAEAGGKELSTESKSVEVLEYYTIPRKRPTYRNPFMMDDEDISPFGRSFSEPPKRTAPPKTEEKEKKKKYSTEKI